MNTGTRLYRPLLWKAYFDKGFGLTNYFKYILLLFGWATSDVRTTIIIGIAWAVGCLILGRLWFHYRLIDTEQEIINLFDPFANEVRGHIRSTEKQKNI